MSNNLYTICDLGENVLTLKDVVDNLAFTYIDVSSIHGNGLFSSRDLRAGEVLGTLDGQYVSVDLYNQLERNSPINLKGYLFTEWNAVSPFTLLVRQFRTKYSFINHSRNPNLKINKDVMSIVVLSDVYKGCELTLDYREEMLSTEYLNGHGATYL